MSRCSIRLNVRRLEMGARCTGIASVRSRRVRAWQAAAALPVFPSADRQAIQWWIADAATKIHACRLMVQAGAATLDAGGDVRNEASMIKVFGTEMATEVVDHAMQTFGAMGMTRNCRCSSWPSRYASCASTKDRRRCTAWRRQANLQSNTAERRSGEHVHEKNARLNRRAALAAGAGLLSRPRSRRSRAFPTARCG